jgi:hypothetical protein
MGFVEGHVPVNADTAVAGVDAAEPGDGITYLIDALDAWKENMVIRYAQIGVEPRNEFSAHVPLEA